MGNLDMYNKYKQPPQEALKPFTNGSFSGTDINPMWRIKVLTEEYGECGFGWYSKLNRVWKEESPGTEEIAVFCEVELYVKRGDTWSAPIVGVGGNTFVARFKNGLKASDEAYKKAYTDALGIACKALGIGADVWWKMPGSKYTEYQDDSEKGNKANEKPHIDGIPAKNAPAVKFDAPRAIEAWCKRSKMTAQRFAELRREAINAGTVPAVEYKDLTATDYSNLIVAIERLLAG